MRFLIRFAVAGVAFFIGFSLWSLAGGLIPVASEGTVEWSMAQLLRLIHLALVLLPFAITLMILFPSLAWWGWERARGIRGTGLKRAERATLDREERSTLAKLRRPKKWAEQSGVTANRQVSNKEGKLENLAALPKIISAELTTRGPAVIIRIAKGTTTAQYDAEKIGGVIRARQLIVERVESSIVRILVPTRDVLEAGRGASSAGRKATDVQLDHRDWVDEDDEGAAL